MPSGGKRQGAGRKPIPTVNTSFTLRQTTADLITSEATKAGISKGLLIERAIAALEKENQMNELTSILESSVAIRIASGEGQVANYEDYTGARSIRAIKTRLTKEQAGGDRWARAEYLRNETDWDILPIE